MTEAASLLSACRVLALRRALQSFVPLDFKSYEAALELHGRALTSVSMPHTCALRDGQEVAGTASLAALINVSGLSGQVETLKEQTQQLLQSVCKWLVEADSVRDAARQVLDEVRVEPADDTDTAQHIAAGLAALKAVADRGSSVTLASLEVAAVKRSMELLGWASRAAEAVAMTPYPLKSLVDLLGEHSTATNTPLLPGSLETLLSQHAQPGVTEQLHATLGARQKRAAKWLRSAAAVVQASEGSRERMPLSDATQLLSDSIHESVSMPERKVLQDAVGAAEAWEKEWGAAQDVDKWSSWHAAPVEGADAASVTAATKAVAKQVRKLVQAARALRVQPPSEEAAETELERLQWLHRARTTAVGVVSLDDLKAAVEKGTALGFGSDGERPSALFASLQERLKAGTEWDQSTMKCVGLPVVARA